MTQKQVAGPGEAAAGSLSYLHGPGDTAGHRQGIRSLRSRQGSRFPRFREDLAGQRKRHASGRLMLSTHTQVENPIALARPPSPAPGLNLQHPKLKPLRGRCAGHPRQTPAAQEVPKLPLSQRQRGGRTLHVRGLGSKGPVGMWEDGVRGGARELSSRAEKNQSWDNSCLRPSAKVVQIPHCPESSSAVLHAGLSADRHRDPRFDAMRDEQRSGRARGVTRVPSPSLQESFKRLVSTGGLMGSEGACFSHLETEPSPSQPQLESGGISPEP